MIYIITRPDGEGQWYKTMNELLESIEFDAYGLNDCGVYFLHLNSAWIDASRQVMDALEEHEQFREWEAEHRAYISSPEKTGRV
jgi:hypothetical protein